MMRPLRVWDCSTIALVLALAAATGLVAARTGADPRFVVSTGALFDDAFFYMVIAEAVASSGRLEFYPGMPTNGVQPLWMVVLTAARATLAGVGTDRLALSLTGVLFLAGAAGWAELLRRRFRVEVAIGFLALTALSPVFLDWVLQGLETALLWAVLPLHAYVVIRAFERGEDDVRIGLGVGLTAALVFLARVDCFTFALSAALFALHRRRPRLLLGVCAGAAVLVLPYLSANVLGFGELMPLSGRAKRFYLGAWFPDLWSYVRSEEWLGLPHALSRLPIAPRRMRGAGLGVAYLAVGAVVLGAALRRRAELVPDARVRLALGSLLLSVALHTFVLYVTFGELRPYTSYYFMPEFLVLALCLVWLVDARLRLRWASTGPFWSLVAVGCFVLAVWSAPQPQTYWVDRLAMADHLRERVDPAATVGAYWPGLFAFYGERPVVPLDGVIASADYQEEVMKPQRELEDLSSRPNPYLVIHLGRPVEAFRADPPQSRSRRWSMAGRRQLVRFGLDRAQLEASFGDWALFSLH